jgi:hypothetical protein
LCRVYGSKIVAISRNALHENEEDPLIGYPKCVKMNGEDEVNVGYISEYPSCLIWRCEGEDRKMRIRKGKVYMFNAILVDAGSDEQS